MEQELHRLVVDVADCKVSFDEFPYYLRLLPEKLPAVMIPSMLSLFEFFPRSKEATGLQARLERDKHRRENSKAVMTARDRAPLHVFAETLLQKVLALEAPALKI
ncbi:hypothetical protein GUJ93_ZPchr0009g636 [Zizania palustris]|uniref:Uncharacterized protein n=1 Tax=Zizania palustris TaxID=103762 RepID=A0A8J5RZ76_ZIZPA|nr:hypothetical protein GUJ93_ZPchr0009g636 [Zizania palustris]